ncbi:MAG: UPF0280 family protein [Proteobacteria bacterium]|nr:UPF0280 family protein [Pseudomonadota bacterium]
MYQERKYRNLLRSDRLVSFRVVVKETDLQVHSAQRLDNITRDLILKYRGYIEAYIHMHQQFAKTLKPWRISGPAPLIVKDMAEAGEKAGVGPMAAVAGAIAERVGGDLLPHTDEVIVENGGDIFMKAGGPVTVGIFAGKSPLSLRIGLRIDSGNKPVSVCTSSGTFGHSLSLGKADAVCVVSGSCSLADAVATAVGNRVKSKKDIQPAIDFGKTVNGINGLLIILEDAIGIWGDVELVPLKGEKG